MRFYCDGMLNEENRKLYLSSIIPSSSTPYLPLVSRDEASKVLQRAFISNRHSSRKDNQKSHGGRNTWSHTEIHWTDRCKASDYPRQGQRHFRQHGGVCSKCPADAWSSPWRCECRQSGQLHPLCYVLGVIAGIRSTDWTGHGWMPQTCSQVTSKSQTTKVTTIDSLASLSLFFLSQGSITKRNEVHSLHSTFLLWLFARGFRSVCLFLAARICPLAIFWIA